MMSNHWLQTAGVLAVLQVVLGCVGCHQHHLVGPVHPAGSVLVDFAVNPEESTSQEEARQQKFVLTPMLFS